LFWLGRRFSRATRARNVDRSPQALRGPQGPLRPGGTLRLFTVRDLSPGPSQADYHAPGICQYLRMAPSPFHQGLGSVGDLATDPVGSRVRTLCDGRRARGSCGGARPLARGRAQSRRRSQPSWAMAIGQEMALTRGAQRGKTRVLLTKTRRGWNQPQPIATPAFVSQNMATLWHSRPRLCEEWAVEGGCPTCSLRQASRQAPGHLEDV